MWDRNSTRGLVYGVRQRDVWGRIQELGVSPNVTNLRTYARYVAEGVAKARLQLRAHDPIGLLTVDDIRIAHRLSFGQVHPWAGLFRQRGQNVEIAGRWGVDYDRIVPELELAIAQMKEMFSRTGNAVVAAAFFHARFERIHPFRDGNGRTGRTILAEQLLASIGKVPTWSSREDYFAAMDEASNGKLAPLVNYLSREMGEPEIEGPLWSPFRIAPYYSGDPDIAANPLQMLELSRMTPAAWEGKRHEEPPKGTWQIILDRFHFRRE